MNRAQKMIALAMILLAAMLVYQSLRLQDVELHYGFALKSLEESDHKFSRCESTIEQCCK